MTIRSKMGVIMPIISVILPAFNAEKYVSEAVHSILSQTFTNFELIIINDGSIDGTLRILERFKDLDERVILVSRENRGLVETLNEGILMARGQWIARMDSDDIAMPNRFERQLQWLEQTGADICGSWVKLFGIANKRILIYPQSDRAIKMGLMFGSMFAHPTVMMRTKSIRLLRYDKTWEKCEDYDLWERATRAGWKMTNVPEVLLLYRQHGEQISSIAFCYQQQLAQKIRHRVWEFAFDSMNLNEKWIEEVLKLREPLPLMPNMDDVDSAFAELLQRNQGEAQATIFDHVTRLYFRAAANCPDAMTRWGKLNDKFGAGFAFNIKIKLWFLSALKIGPDSICFQKMKNYYYWVNRL